MLLLMLRPEGVCGTELTSIYGYSCKDRIRVLLDEKGWDVRTFPMPSDGSRGHPGVRYKIVGKFFWDGRYRSFVRP